MTKSISNKPSQVLIKIGFVVLWCLCFQSIAWAQLNEQNGLSKNGVYLDVGMGVGMQASFNYERNIHSGEKVHWYGRLGAGFAGVVFGEGGPGGLGAITMLTGKKNGHFELNAGAFIGKNSGDSFIYPLLDVGYRYQKPEGGFIFRAKVGILGLGIGLGYAF